MIGRCHSRASTNRMSRDAAVAPAGRRRACPLRAPSRSAIEPAPLVSPSVGQTNGAGMMNGRYVTRLVAVAVISGVVIAGMGHAAGASPLPVVVAISLDRSSIPPTVATSWSCRSIVDDHGSARKRDDQALGEVDHGEELGRRQVRTQCGRGARRQRTRHRDRDLDEERHRRDCRVDQHHRVQGQCDSQPRPRRRSVVVFASGASSFVSCSAPGVCGDRSERSIRSVACSGRRASRPPTRRPSATRAGWWTRPRTRGSRRRRRAPIPRSTTSCRSVACAP